MNKFNLKYNPSAIESYFNNKYPNVEVEGDETLLEPTGKLSKFNGPKHSQGGIETYIPPKSIVFSEHIKLPKQLVNQIIGKEATMSPAQLSKKFPTKGYMDILANPKSNDLEKKTANYMLEKNLATLMTIFNAQESYKQSKGKPNDLDYVNNKMSENGLEVAQNGFIWNPFEEAMRKKKIPDNWQPVTPSTNMNDGYLVNYKNVLTPEEENLTHQSLVKNGPYDSVKLMQQKLMPIKSNNIGDVVDDNTSRLIRMATASKFINPARMDDKNMPLYGKNVSTGQWEMIPKNKALNEGFNLASNYSDAQILNYIDGFNPGDEGLDKYGKPNINNQYQVSVPEYEKFDLRQNDIVKPIPTKPINQLSVKSTNDLKGPNITNNTTPTTTSKNVHYRDNEDMMKYAHDAFMLSQLRKQIPYYGYPQLEHFNTRFEPMNNMAAERMYSSFVNNINNSNLPEAVKQAQLADVNAKMMDEASKVQMANIQGDTANDNRNVQGLEQMINRNNESRERANYQYTKENQIAQGQLDDMKYALLDNVIQTGLDRNSDEFKVNMMNITNPNFEADVNGNFKLKPRDKSTSKNQWFANNNELSQALQSANKAIADAGITDDATKKVIIESMLKHIMGK